MDKEFIDEMYNKLLQEKSGLLRSIYSENEDMKAAVGDKSVGDLADAALHDFDISLLDAIGHKDMVRLQMIETAIGRIAADRYGVCNMCKREIPQDRLEAIPYAALCISCQESTENRK